jgi:hypothetical protein
MGEYRGELKHVHGASISDDSLQLRPEPPGHVSHVRQRLRLPQTILRLSRNTYQVLCQLRTARCNRLPQTPNLALKCAHVARQRPTLLRRQVNASRSLRPLAFDRCLMQPINFPSEQAERPIVRL